MTASDTDGEGLIGRIAGIVRYPVKSMAGEVLTEAWLNAQGLEGDRLYAFESTNAPPGMLRLSGRERRAMLGYNAFTASDGGVQVRTPAGEVYEVESAALLLRLQDDVAERGTLRLTRAKTPQTDVRPLALISHQTIRKLAQEFALGTAQPLDPRRFRANLYVELDAGAFAEDAICGQRLRVGEATILIRERDPRCRFITYDPDAPLTTEPLFNLMKLLDRRHEGRAGVYASVVTPGTIRAGDEISIAASGVDSMCPGESNPAGCQSAQ